MPLYEYRDGADGLGYYRHAAAPPPADPIEQARAILREAAAAGADFVRCAEFVGEFAWYDFREESHQHASEGAGYYRQVGAPPPDAREYSIMVLQRASAAAADFVACEEAIIHLPGYEHRSTGPDGSGYYRLGYLAGALAPAPPPTSSASSGNFDDFMSSMRELGAV